ncbi:glycosyltransferase [Corynebacterium sp. YIM 101645]|uniref:Glycosyltransferase n=1 Tax=Corynebacterium lemuris TaxID=1859292 RepID=A0ABT2FYP4_9CORY|nr:glycosyltransferase [Corynebacterium lemuris]MCS5480353.1 glycosyltransferase [Corynebacterium lemuris]
MSPTRGTRRIALIAPARYPIREPYAGGMEAFCHTLVRAVRDMGHTVDLFAARGSQGHVTDFELPGVDWADLPLAASDTGYPPGAREAEDAAFRALLQRLSAGGYDIIHNNSLTPHLFHPTAELPLMTTLHTPALADMQEAIAGAGEQAGRFAAVSATTAADWVLPTPATVIPNGVDTIRWQPGPGGQHAVWFGRIVPEKGLHLAMDACRRVGIPLVFAGRVGDHHYFSTHIVPRMTGQAATWVGALDHKALKSLVGRSRVCVVTPRWEEPFGLVAFEAMAAGTPVAAFRRGGLGEILSGAPACLAEPDDVDSLAAAVLAAADLDRGLVREWVTRHHSLSEVARRYLGFYREVVER